MANAHHTVGSLAIKIFAGGDIGTARHDMARSELTFAPGVDPISWETARTVQAGQVMAGVNTPVNDRIAEKAGCRFVDSKKPGLDGAPTTRSNRNAEFGLVFRF